MKKYVKILSFILTLLMLSPILSSCGVKWDDEKEEETRAPKMGGEYKYIALTFDDGPNPMETKTRAIVDKMIEVGGACTFFVVGNKLDSTTGNIIKYAADNGCEIGIHGYTHEVYYDNCSDSVYEEEISKTRSAIERYTGITPTLMRPIGGRISAERAEESEYAVILWSVDSEDWEHKACSTDEEEEENIEYIVSCVLDTVNDGDIILMHDIYNNSVKAAFRIIDALYAEGYRFVTVSDLLGLGKSSAGHKYYSR